MRKWAWPQLRYALWSWVLVKLILPPNLTSPVSVTSVIPYAARNVVNVSLVRQSPEVAGGERLVASEPVPVSVLEQGGMSVLTPVETSPGIPVVASKSIYGSCDFID